MKILSYFLIFFFTQVLISHAKVDAYNYNFSLEQLAPFYPGNRISDIKDLVILTKENGFTLAQTDVIYERYKFSVFIQAQDEVIVDFFARLPSYFLHDLLHQALINRFGKQSSYIKKENAALYIWKTEDGLTHYYQGSCTINCFPEYYSVVGKDFPPELIPFVERLDLNIQ